MSSIAASGVLVGRGEFHGDNDKHGGKGGQWRFHVSLVALVLLVGIIVLFAGSPEAGLRAVSIGGIVSGCISIIKVVSASWYESE